MITGNATDPGTTVRTNISAIDPFACRNPGLHARIGVARTMITPAPDAPINNWGAAKRTIAAGLQSDLTATVLTIAPLDSETAVSPELVLVALDLGWWRTPSAADALQQQVARSVGVEPHRVLVSLSHTHAGPAIDPEAVEPTASAAVAGYLQSLAGAVSRAATDAVRTAEPAVLEWGRGSCDLARVRDQWLEREQRYVCGYDPGGHPDPTLLVGRIVADQPDPDGRRLRALIVNYACHPTTLGPENSEISADFPAVARDLVEARCAAPMIFLQGASGELAPRRQYEAGSEAVQANGEQLGFSVLATLAGMLPTQTRLINTAVVESGAPLGIWSPQADTPSTRIAFRNRQVAVPRNPSAGRWASADGLSETARAERERRNQQIESLSGQAQHAMPLAVWRLGDVGLVAIAGEPYSVLQRDLRASFTDRAIVVLNLTGGAHHGYLPPAVAYRSELYQVWQTPAGQGSLELVRDASAKLLDELFDDGGVRADD
jgi:hypothetical protein